MSLKALKSYQGSQDSRGQNPGERRCTKGPENSHFFLLEAFADLQMIKLRQVENPIRKRQLRGREVGQRFWQS